MAKTTANMRRFPGAVLSSSAAPPLAQRDRVFILTCIGLITALAWVYLVHLGHQMSSAMTYEQAMAAMGMAVNTPWEIGDVLFTFAMWAVMMVGMMAPAAAPILLLFGAAQAKRGERRALPAVAMFALGYVGIWIAFSVGAAIAQWGLHGAAMLSMAMATSSPRLGGTILIAAGAYQLTALKNRCLTHCRSPLGFLLTNWRDGQLGAFRMGSRHGIYCLGCCWALMCVLFAVGIMNLLWVAALTAFVLVEKIGPKSAVAARLAGAALIVLGIFTTTHGLFVRN